MARVVVTGGAGFIGSHIVDMLLGEGHEILILDDLSSGTRSNVPAKAVLEVCDVRSPQAQEVLKGFKPEVLVHAAAQISVRKSMEDPVFDTEVNLVGLVNLLQTFSGNNYPYVVFISTGGALYGEQSEFPAREDHAIAPESVYGLAKYSSELYLDLWARVFGLKYVALRLANVYGPRQNPHGEAGVVAIFNQALLSGRKAFINGDGLQTRDFVYVGDVARAVRSALDKRASGAFNIGTGREVNVKSLYSLIKDAVGTDAAAEFAPAKSGEQQRSCISFERARNELGWQPEVPLERGIELTTEWFRSQLKG